MIAIQTANLTKKYGDIIAINGVDLEVEAGEIVGCLGPERSGKTTLLRLLTGLVRPTLGDSTVLGLSSVKESRKLRAKSGIVTDTAACIGSMSALENLLMFASMYGMRKEQARTHAAQLLKKLDLWNARDRKVYTFSTEMCRRLSLARALVHHPQIVFSDGLPGGEQAVSDAMVLRTLSDYAKETGATVLLCTDHLESAEEICTRATRRRCRRTSHCVMARGKSQSNPKPICRSLFPGLCGRMSVFTKHPCVRPHCRMFITRL